MTCNIEEAALSTRCFSGGWPKMGNKHLCPKCHLVIIVLALGKLDPIWCEWFRRLYTVVTLRSLHWATCSGGCQSSSNKSWMFVLWDWLCSAFKRKSPDFFFLFLFFLCNFGLFEFVMYLKCRVLSTKVDVSRKHEVGE